MVFQDARGALNPVLTVGSQLVEAILSHQRVSRRAAKEQALALFAEVGFAEPAFTFGRYPGELSGGMCQRAAIAAAICNRPKLLIADEPTSALDPGIQAQIMQVLGAMKQQHGLALILISHDLALVSEAAERIAVMYHGRMVESGEAGAVLHAPAHPYTGALLACLPDLNRCWDRDPLESIPGAPPSRLREHPGCAFSERCSQSGPDCSATQPAPVAVADGHWAACLRPSFPPAAKF
jgi:oligopeptide/dipeptide ABC transporter ATP-binding protein